MVLLVSYSGLSEQLNRFLPDNGLALLASHLKAQKHKVKIIDFNLPWFFQLADYQSAKATLYRSIENEKNCESHVIKLRKELFIALTKQFETNIIQHLIDYICRHNIKTLGVKLWLGDGARFWQQALPEIKETYPDLHIIFGGPSVSVFGKEDLFNHYPDLDCAVFGPGEKFLPLLVDAFRSKNKYLVNEQIEYNTRHKNKIPVSVNDDDRSYLPHDYSPDTYLGISSGINLLVAENGFGCFNKCAFCIHPTYNRRSYQSSIDEISLFYERLLFLRQRYHTNYFRFSASNTPYNFLQSFSRLNKTNLKYSAFCHLHSFENKNLHEIIGNSLVAVFFGVETFDSDVLYKALNKSYDKDKAANTIRFLSDNGVHVVGSFICPLPFQDDNQIDNIFHTGNLFSKANTSVEITFPYVRPNTDWWDNADKYQIRINKEAYKEFIFFGKVSDPAIKDNIMSINGKGFIKLKDDYKKMVLVLQDKKVLLHVKDEDVLMSRASGMNVRDFYNKSRESFYLFDHNQMKKLVRNINKGIAKDYSENAEFAA